MSNIKLSFCIPTYNRADFIGQTLTSIADQIVQSNWTNCIEICVSDNASTDNTDEVIRNFQAKYPSIYLIYSKNSVNVGADRNFLRVVELASGEYCWLLGSDDALVPRAIDIILQELHFNYDIILSNRVKCDYNLNWIKTQYWLDATTKDHIFNFNTLDSYHFYLTKAQSLGALFSYLSSIVIKKTRWCGIRIDDNFIGTAYVHVYVLLSIVIHGAKMKYIVAPLVLCRGGNDSFATDGVLKRMMLDIDGYIKLSSLFNSLNTVPLYNQTNNLALNPNISSYCNLKNEFLLVVKREHPWFRWCKIKLLATYEEWNHIKISLKQIGYTNFELIILEGVGKFRFLFKSLFYIKTKLGIKFYV